MDTNDFALFDGEEVAMNGLRYADLHCDALTAKRRTGEKFYERKDGQVNLQRLVSGGCALQVFALFSRSKEVGAWERTLGYIKDFEEGKGVLIRNKITPVLAVEDGGSVENDRERVAFLLEKGVRIFGLTWNDENCLGAPCGSAEGLTAFGQETMEFLCAKGVYVDVSHLSDRGTEQALAVSYSCGVPTVATHSLCRSVCGHKRNLTDEQIRKIADGGGLIGVNFVPEFVGEKGIFAHIRHILQVGGEDVIAVGSDFDGTENPVYPSASDVPRFLEDLKKSGFSERLIEKIAFRNVERLLE